MTAEEFEQVKECARCAAVEQIHDFVILMVKEGKKIHRTRNMDLLWK